jgi:hypothetical protein
MEVVGGPLERVVEEVRTVVFSLKKNTKLSFTSSR